MFKFLSLVKGTRGKLNNQFIVYLKVEIYSETYEEAMKLKDATF